MTELKKPTIFTWEFTVLETHLDTFGHMNHATYLQLFEQARWELVTSRGYGLDKIHQTKIGPTILNLTVHYKRELRLREKVLVETYCPEYRGKVGTVCQRMLNSKNEEAATIELTIGLFDMKTRKLVQATPDWLHAVGIEE